MVTISVKTDKKKLTIHKHALNSIAKGFFSMLQSLESRETKPGTVDRADLPEEQEETFGAILKWLYAAYIGITCGFLSSSTVLLFHLYAFAYKYTINILEDAIVSALWEQFATDDALWLTLGSDKRALETLLKVVPPKAHLYRLFIRSLAYSMRLPAERQWPEPADAWRYSTLPRTPATVSQVEKVMESITGELLGLISKEVLLVKTLGAWRQGFASTVGYESECLRRYEDLVNDGPSASGW